LFFAFVFLIGNLGFEENPFLPSEMSGSISFKISSLEQRNDIPHTHE
jgi:hypothetical protein